MEKLVATIVSVVLAVGGSALLWVVANQISAQATRRFRLYSGLVGATAGALLFTLIDGNRLVTGLRPRPASLFNGDEPGVFTDGFVTALLGHFFWPLVGALIGAGLGLTLAILTDRRYRIAASVGTGVAVGLILSFALKSRYELAMRSTPLVLWPLAFAAIAALAGYLLRRDRLTRSGLINFTIFGAFVGWLFGSFGSALNNSNSNQLETSIAFVVAGVLAGFLIGNTSRPDTAARARIDDKTRAWIFVGPAALFIFVMLVMPGIQTLLISLQADDAANVVEGFVGFENYKLVFQSEDNFDASKAAGLFVSDESNSWFPWGGSALLPWAVFFGAVAIILTFLSGRESGQKAQVGGPSIAAVILSIAIFSFALFTHLRGTIINNLWWVVGVTLLATSLGLMMAKLSDGAKFESVAKSFVFMPMAVSMVGASIIWRLIMYQARDVSKNQTGVFNAIWVWLGENTTQWGSTSGIITGLLLLAAALVVLYAIAFVTDFIAVPGIAGTVTKVVLWIVAGVAIIALIAASFNTMGGKAFFGGLFALAAAALFVLAVRALHRSPSIAFLYVALTLIPLYVTYRTWGAGIGGFKLGDDGAIRALTINFVQDGPYNNFWLMMILIWIQTGFAMVILSAAIKAVPEDFIEAAHIDGADDTQVFWRIVLPQIAPTVGVVATTIMVNVMKVFDIVKVTTNGQFGSQVLANAMFTQAFLFSNAGIGAALAILIFVGVFPVMVFNIYRISQEA